MIKRKYLNGLFLIYCRAHPVYVDIHFAREFSGPLAMRCALEYHVLAGRNENPYVARLVAYLALPPPPVPEKSVLVSDTELLSTIIPTVVRGIPGKGIVPIAATSNMYYYFPWANRNKDRRWIALNLPETFIAMAIHFRMKIVIL